MYTRFVVLCRNCIRYKWLPKRRRKSCWYTFIALSKFLTHAFRKSAWECKIICCPIYGVFSNGGLCFCHAARPLFSLSSSPPRQSRKSIALPALADSLPLPHQATTRQFLFIFVVRMKRFDVSPRRLLFLRQRHPRCHRRGQRSARSRRCRRCRRRHRHLSVYVPHQPSARKTLLFFNDENYFSFVCNFAARRCSSPQPPEWVETTATAPREAPDT